MNVRLTFDGAKVLELVADAEKHQDHFLTMDQRFSKYNTLDEVEGEEKGAPAGLWLVHDAGYYLMSNSFPERSGPLYARGDRFEDDSGVGDDFVEFIGADEPVLKALADGHNLGVTIGENTITYRVVR